MIENFNPSRKFQSLAGLSLRVFAKLSNSHCESLPKQKKEAHGSVDEVRGPFRTEALGKGAIPRGIEPSGVGKVVKLSL